MPIITICASASFYRQVVEIQKQLEDLGYTVLIPHAAHIMKNSQDYDVTHYKTWFDNADDYHKKADLMRKHFDEIAKGDAVLVLNYEKNAQANYIGGNVLIEMALAFYLHKPIFIFNEIPNGTSYEEEIRGFIPSVLHGDLNNLVLPGL